MSCLLETMDALLNDLLQWPLSQRNKKENNDNTVGYCYVTVIIEGSLDTLYIATCDGKMII